MLTLLNEHANIFFVNKYSQMMLVSPKAIDVASVFKIPMVHHKNVKLNKHF